jgi:DNA invertase Pin-like site-specific DNA recombinase
VPSVPDRHNDPQARVSALGVTSAAHILNHLTRLGGRGVPMLLYPEMSSASDVQVAFKSIAREGDVLVVWRLDRLGRSLPNLIEVVADLERRGFGFKSVTESIDTTTTGGKLIFHIFGALAEFEKNLVRDRTIAGLQAARKRGRVGGRPRSVSDEKLAAAKRLLRDGTPPKDVAETIGVSVPTLYRWLPASKSAA